MSSLRPALFLLWGLALAPQRVQAQATWLDSPLVSWNAPGQGVPQVPQAPPVEPQCAEVTRRPVETPEDRTVASAGWTLIGPYRLGWGISVVEGTLGYDGMCRPDN